MIDLKHKLPRRNMVNLKKCRSCKNTFIITSGKLQKTDCCSYSSLYDVQKRFTWRFVLGSIGSNIIYFILFACILYISRNMNYQYADILRKIFFVFGLTVQAFAILIPILLYPKFVAAFMLSDETIRSEIKNGFDNSEIFIHNTILEITSSITTLNENTKQKLITFYRLAYELSYICDSPILASARLRALLFLPMTKASFVDLERMSSQLVIMNNINENDISRFIEKAAVLNPIQIGKNTLRLYKLTTHSVENVNTKDSKALLKNTAMAKVYATALKNDELFFKYIKDISKVHEYLTPWEKIIFSQINKGGDVK